MKSKATKPRATKPKKVTSGGKLARRVRKGKAVAAPAEGDQHPASVSRPKLVVEVVWGNITQAEGDIHFVGHYMGVLPQKAERALDRAMSGDTGDGTRRIIREWTKRGLLRGALGEIAFFPWDPGKLIGVAGMGRPGTFNRAQLKILARSIARSAGLLPHRRTVATVLIGTGSGNLRLKDAAQTLVEGVAEALNEDPSLNLDKLRIVEQYLDRATEILDILTPLGRQEKLGLELHPQLVREGGGEVSPEFSCSLLLASLADAGDAAAGQDGATTLNQLLANLPAEGEISRKAREKLEQVRQECKVEGGEERLHRLAMCLRLREEDAEEQSPEGPIPARVAFWTDDQNIHAAAITNTVTVTERTIAGRMGLVERAVEMLMDPPPDAEQLAEWTHTLLRLLVHNDVKDVLWRNDSLVIEVDAKLARVQWEMLPSAQDGKPLGIARSLARQLRTTYSPRLDEIHARRKLKALVIGDPGDPQLGQELEHARKEARAVSKLLKDAGIDTDVLIGPPEDGTNVGPLQREGIPAADYFEVVRLLLCKDYDIVHYCGHAQFDPDMTERAGWVFKGGVLTARELEGMERPPSLVVANACVTARFAQSNDAVAADAGQSASAGRKHYPGLVAGLADEFFRWGVSDYIGTAWEVPSAPAAEFATTLYKELLAGAFLGEAVRRAREELYTRYATKAAVWAAYQHYGDPTRTFNVV